MSKNLSRLGYDGTNYGELKSEILSRASRYPVKLKKADNFGSSYEQKIILYGNKNKPANVIIGWKEENKNTWMASAYIKEMK